MHSPCTVTMLHVTQGVLSHHFKMVKWWLVVFFVSFVFLGMGWVGGHASITGGEM